MRLTVKSAAAVAALAVGMPSLASAQQQQAQGSSEAQTALTAMAGNAANWVMPNGDYANTRYSELSQINKDNVKNLQVAWTFSTGVLRGHEGGPLVIGNMMYVHTPFPNIVYAHRHERPRQAGRLEVRAEAGPERHPGDVLRHRQPRCGVRRRQDLPAPGRHHAGGARRQHRQGGLDGQDRRPVEGRHRHLRAGRLQRQGLCRRVGRRVRRARLARGLQHVGRQAGLARLLDGAGQRHAARPAEDDLARQAGRAGQRHEHLAGRPVEDRRRHHLGLDLRRSRAEPRLLRLGQPLDLEPDAAAR